MKKAISILLSVVLLLSVMPMMLASAKAEDQWQVMYDWEEYTSVQEVADIVEAGTPTETKYQSTVAMATITNAESYPEAQTNRLDGSVKAINFQQNAMHTVGNADAYAVAGKIKLDTTMMANAKDLRFYMCYRYPEGKDGTINQAIGIKLSNGEFRYQNGFNSADANGETMSSLYSKKWNWYNFVGKTFKLCTDTSDIIEITEENVKDIEEILFWNRCSTYDWKWDPNRTFVDNVEYLTEVDETADVISTQEGASIRLNAKNGIRFYTTINEDVIAALNPNNEKTVEYGTIIAPADLVEGEFTHEDDHIDVKYTADELYTDATGFVGIVGSIVDIQDRNIGRNFVGRGYVKIGDNYYYSKTTSTRSLKSVAAALQSDTKNAALYTANKALVDSWALAVDWKAQ